MKVCVAGLWHLGSVTAAGLAACGHQVVGLDDDPQRIAALNRGTAPVFEPGLEELLARVLRSGHLRFTTESADALAGCEVIWVCYDVGVAGEGLVDAGVIVERIGQIAAALPGDTTVVVSSQLPIGSMQQLGRLVAGATTAQVTLACCPENLRLGNAVEDFLRPARIVVGIPADAGRGVLRELLGPLNAPIEWLTVESAELSKHALNAFLAVSVGIANEIATICERVGADAKEVERALKSDRRIGPRAYLAPGEAFAGDTLARGVAFLASAARERQIETPILSAVLPSNDAHSHWATDKLRGLFPDLRGITIAVWGLGYKAGTDALRGSLTVALCEQMINAGAQLQVHDPVVKELPVPLRGVVTRAADALAAVRGAQALVVGAAWADYREFTGVQLLAQSANLVVLDASHLLPHLAHSPPGLRYFAVGTPGGSA